MEEAQVEAILRHTGLFAEDPAARVGIRSRWRSSTERLRCLPSFPRYYNPASTSQFAGRPAADQSRSPRL